LGVKPLLFHQKRDVCSSKAGFSPCSTAFGPIKSIHHLVKFDNLHFLYFEGWLGMDDYNFDIVDRLAHLKYLSLCNALILEMKGPNMARGGEKPI